MNNNDYISLHRCFLKSLNGASKLPTGETAALLSAYRDGIGDIFVAMPLSPFKNQVIVIEDRTVAAADIVDVEMWGYRTRYFTSIILASGEKIEFFLR